MRAVSPLFNENGEGEEKMNLLDVISEMSQEEKEDLRKEKELWTNTYNEELKRVGNPAEAQAIANQKLEMLGKFKFGNQTINSDLVSEMDKIGF